MKELACYILGILLIILLALGFVIFANYLESENVQPGIHLTESEASYINKELNRRYLEAGLSQEDIQAKFDAFKPGVTMDRVVDPIAAMAAKLAKMTPEEREEAFAALKAKIETAG